jgi:hypothetical protein
MQRLPSLLTEVDQWVESSLQGNLHGGFGGGSGETSERKRALLLPYLSTSSTASRTTKAFCRECADRKGEGSEENEEG